MKALYILALPTLFHLACKPATSTPTENTQIPSHTDTVSQGVSETDPGDSASVSPTPPSDPVVPPGTQQPPPVVKTKICAPNFTKLAALADHHFVYYVTQFNPEEFKCWVLLEEHGTALSGGQPCVIYYVEDPGIKIEPGLPHHMLESTLRTSGVGRYVHNGKYWEIKGASQWKRKDKGYGYYNTDNQLGG